MPAGLSNRAQREALATAGVDTQGDYAPVYVDERDVAIASLANGDQLAVAEPGCLGTTSTDILKALAAVGRAGASVLDVSSGKTVSWHPGAQAALDFATSADKANREAIARKMRKARAASGGKPAFEWDAATVKRLQALDAAGELSREEIARELGCSRSTVQRKLRELTQP